MKIPSEVEVAPRYKLLTLLTLFSMLTWFTLLTWFILLRKVRTLSEWADALESKCWMDGLVDWTRLL